MISSVARAVNDICHCDFSRDSFHDIDNTAGFQCFDSSPTAVTFRAEIMDSERANISQLIAILEQWVLSQPTIVVLSSRLSIDSDCSVEIESYSEAECSTIGTSSSSDNSSRIGSIAGGILGGLLVLVIVVVVIIGLVVKLRKKASYSLDTDSIYE